MDLPLAEKIKRYVTLEQQRPIPFAPAAEPEVVYAERALGFLIPEPLRSLYLTVGNGGFGPGRGGRIIGFASGHGTSAGDVVATYRDVQRGAAYLGIRWPDKLLPFCEWGCNIFSCVDCGDPGLRVYLSEDCDARSQSYDLAGFVAMWLAGVDLLDAEQIARGTTGITNPFTGNHARVTRATRKKDQD